MSSMGFDEHCQPRSAAVVANMEPVAAARDLLTKQLPIGSVRFDVPLSQLGRWRIGGPADIVVEPATAADLAVVLKTIGDTSVPHVIIGDGSNLLFDDAGLRGVVVKIGRSLGEFRLLGDRVVEAGAGLWVPTFVRRIIAAGLAGATHAIGIPGTLGGLVTMNGGSQRRGIGEHVIHVDALDYAGHLHRLDQAALTYSYRASRLQAGGLVMVSARFQFEKGDAAALRREALGILGARRAKFPKIRANCGSVFVSDPKLYQLIGPPGRAIEQAGLKGAAVGDAQISPDHANFIVNNGQARSSDVLTLIATARRRVFDLTGVAMQAEVRHLSPDGSVHAAHDVLHQAAGSALSTQETPA